MTRNASSRRIALSGDPAPLLFLAACGVVALMLALQLLSGVKPWRAYAPVEITDDLLAACGFAWTALQIRTHWRDRALRKVWLLAALGFVAIALVDDTEEIGFVMAHEGLSWAVGVALWGVAAALFFACGRRYAMRRSVMTALGLGLVLQIVVNVASLVEHWSETAHGHPTALLKIVVETGESMTLLAYISALVLTQFAPLKSYGAPDSEVGREGRRLYADFGLRRAARYPTPYPALQLPVLSHITTIAMILWFGAKIAPSVARACGRSVAGQFADLARLGLLHGVDPRSYYLMELYQPERAGLADAVMTRAETKNGLIGHLHAAAGLPDCATEMTDKVLFGAICAATGVASAPILAHAENGAVAILAEPEAFDRPLFVKDRAGRGGKHAARIDRDGAFVFRMNGAPLFGLGALMERLAERSGEGAFIVQPALDNHPEIASLATTSLIVFRVVTCLDASGEPQATHGVLRIIAKFEPDWPRKPDSEWGADIDLATGRLGPLTGDKAYSCWIWRDAHPVTGERIAGRTISGWPAIAAAACTAHGAFRGRALVGWDVAWTPDGPVILEGNSNMDVAFVQRCARTPIGLSPLAPLVNAQLKRLAESRLAGLSEAEGRKFGAARVPSPARGEEH